MKKIGKEKLLKSCNDTNMRNGEGAFIRLKDGRILHAYTKYGGDGGDDNDTACIAAVYSSDEGESWSEDSVLFENPEHSMNVMSVSLLRMENGDLGLIFVRKYMADGEVMCVPMLYRSSDEGRSFYGGIAIISHPSYYVLCNDKVIRLKNGRILLAVSNHRKLVKKGFGGGVVEVYCSDDDGRSFQKLGDDLHSPFNDPGTRLAEPGLLELPDGRIWMYIRTGYGHQYQSLSCDNGSSWTPVAANYKLTSAAAPMTVKNVGKYTVAIWNPMPISEMFSKKIFWGNPKFTRTPFVAAVSLDGGVSMVEQDFSSRTGEFLPFIERCYFIEDDYNESYCYPSIYEVQDGFLVAYYFSNGSNTNLNSTRITKVRFEELE